MKVARHRAFVILDGTLHFSGMHKRHDVNVQVLLGMAACRSPRDVRSARPAGTSRRGHLIHRPFPPPAQAGEQGGLVPVAVHLPPPPRKPRWILPAAAVAAIAIAYAAAGFAPGSETDVATTITALH